MVGLTDEGVTRSYLGFPMQVPFYLEEAWSFCSPPSEAEQPLVAEFMKDKDWPGARFEAVCKIDVDGEFVVRGVIASVPKV